MNTQKLTTCFFGHRVEVTLVTADDGDKCYASIPNSVVDLFQNVWNAENGKARSKIYRTMN